MLNAEITRHECCIALSVEQFRALEKLDDLDVVSPALEKAGALKGTIEYSGHFGPNVFFTIDAENDPQPVAAALAQLLGLPIAAGVAVDRSQPKAPSDADDKKKT